MKIGPEKIQACTGFEPYFYYCWIFFRPYFHYCVNGKHYQEDRFHINFFIRCAHMWFSYTYSHLVSTILLRTTYRQPALKTPSTTAILEWMSLNRKLVLVAQMKIQLIFSVLINLCWEFWKNFTIHSCANINVTLHRFDWKILSGHLAFQ